MNLQPVIAREMRVQSRQAFSYWLRISGAGTLMLLAWVYSSNAPQFMVNGAALFSRLHSIMYWLIWLLVPLLAADCISREKREGTLGLLFLTPLKARDIVVAKGFSQGLRALTLCVAVIPVLAIPILMGGVSFPAVLLALLVNANALCWALTAGLLASATTKWPFALVIATGWAAVFHFLLCMVTGIAFESIFPSGWLQGGLGTLGIFFNMGGMLWAPRGGRVPIQASWVGKECLVSLCSLLGVVLVLGVTASCVKSGWQDKPPSALRLWMRGLFCEPMFFLGIFKRWMRHKLNKNPIGWLEQRRWSSRLIVWGWLGIMISFYSFALMNMSYNFGNYSALNHILGSALLVSISLSAAGSFQRERETGLLELLLVSPLRVSQVMWGRIRGVWGQFLLAIVLLAGLWFMLLTDAHHFSYWNPDAFQQWPALWLYVCGYLTLPIIGLYFSLSRRYFITAFLWTIVVGMLLPLAVMIFSFRLCAGFWEIDYGPGFAGVFGGHPLRMYMGLAPTLLQLGLASWLGYRLYSNLSQRKFALSR